MVTAQATTGSQNFSSQTPLPEPDQARETAAARCPI